MRARVVPGALTRRNKGSRSRGPRLMKVRSTQPPEAIDALLPQAQCRQCGYPGCLPYAEAIAAGRAAINQCPPGGDETIRALAGLLDVPVEPLDPAFGAIKPPQVARIDEATCIGCTLCLQACPVDAIVGAPKLMHTVIDSECTGCELCIPPCPVDCIDMVAIADDTTQAQWRRPPIVAPPAAVRH